MVAYSFNRRFAEAIAICHPFTGIVKRQTIRAPRKRHARPGETLQLYQGMRTKHCRKIIPDPVCVDIRPVELFIEQSYVRFLDTGLAFGMTALLDDFARQDGFLDWADLQAFWRAAHPAPVGLPPAFSGMLIRWEPAR
ncbi:hypothetical protein [Bosea minatitlanensis]|uniref:ASCH domain-containing protein n=1 Tax=Bosea minatitlanensis TaxID=128782 RepID=A0ABW0F1A1_9HYPH|nr:hypothetical protein [Bosea minatitlanensis]MCT4491781.1 hypothetical protein [Bosea minatitlanensis]